MTINTIIRVLCIDLVDERLTDPRQHARVVSSGWTTDEGNDDDHH